MDKEAVKGDSNRNAHPYQAKFYDVLDILWDKLPSSLAAFIATTLIFLAGISIRGDWLLIIVHLIKQFSNTSDPAEVAKRTESPFSLEKCHLKDFIWCILSSFIFSYVIYFILCGFLQWYFYIRQRDRPEDWKCQPKKFLTWENEKHEIILGIFGIGLGSTISGIMSFYVMNGGYSTLYYRLDEYGWIYFFFSIPAVFLLIDGGFYYYHRMFHLPFLYKRFHKVHHRYKQPTAFSASAMHPFEFVILQSATIVPSFLIPVHWAAFMGINLYCFYYGIMDHSGVKMEAIWPWQPNTTFHDNHHEFFHTNFGFNTKLWDWLHGTLRKENRIYSEDIFYGFGKRWEDATEEEKKTYVSQHEIKKTS